MTRKIAATALFAALVGTGARVDAFCRGVDQRAPYGYDQQTLGCFTGTPAGSAKYVFWGNQCVGYSLQQDASSQVTLAQATQVAGQAFAAWSEVTCADGGRPSINGADEGPVACSMVEYNKMAPNQHVIIFRDDGWPGTDPNNPLGLTSYTANLDTGELYDADIELNSSQYQLVVDGPVPAGAYDLATVLTHEVGHFLGLAHSNDPNAIMYAHYHAGATIGPDDVAGICAIYPSDGTRVTSDGAVPAATCDPMPRHNFSSLCGSTLGDTGATPGEDETTSPQGCSLASARGHERARPWGFALALAAWTALGRRRRRARTTDQAAR